MQSTSQTASSFAVDARSARKTERSTHSALPSARHVKNEFLYTGFWPFGARAGAKRHTLNSTLRRGQGEQGCQQRSEANGLNERAACFCSIRLQSKGHRYSPARHSVRCLHRTFGRHASGKVRVLLLPFRFSEPGQSPASVAWVALFSEQGDNNDLSWPPRLTLVGAMLTLLVPFLGEEGPCDRASAVRLLLLGGMISHPEVHTRNARYLQLPSPSRSLRLPVMLMLEGSIDQIGLSCHRLRVSDAFPAPQTDALKGHCRPGLHHSDAIPRRPPRREEGCHSSWSWTSCPASDLCRAPGSASACPCDPEWDWRTHPYRRSVAVWLRFFRDHVWLIVLVGVADWNRTSFLVRRCRACAALT